MNRWFSKIKVKREQEDSINQIVSRFRNEHPFDYAAFNRELQSLPESEQRDSVQKKLAERKRQFVNWLLS